LFCFVLNVIFVTLRPKPTAECGTSSWKMRWRWKQGTKVFSVIVAAFRISLRSLHRLRMPACVGCGALPAAATHAPPPTVTPAGRQQTRQFYFANKVMEFGKGRRVCRATPLLLSVQLRTHGCMSFSPTHCQCKCCSASCDMTRASEHCCHVSAQTFIRMTAECNGTSHITLEGRAAGLY
jgi:hypothetical protein